MSTRRSKRPEARRARRRKTAKELSPEDAAEQRQMAIIERARLDLAESDWKRAAVCSACGYMENAEGEFHTCRTHPFVPHFLIQV